MIDLYWWATSNGHKVTIALEELGLDYRLHRIDITAGDQHRPTFLDVCPNGKIPAIVDHDPPDAGAPLALFESGAILLYLAEKTGRFMPDGFRARQDAMVWLMWQAAGFGPMLGQAHHFNRKAPADTTYARDRYNTEAQRLYNVLEQRLSGRDYLAGSYSMADIMVFPWTRRATWQNIDLEDFPAVAAWQARIASRPAVIRAYDLAGPV